MTTRERIAGRIKALREQAGLTQAELARQVGVERQQVAAWEGGRHKPSEDSFLAVAQALQTSISFLYGETEDPRPASQWGTNDGPSTKARARAQEAAAHLGRAMELLQDLD